MAGFVLDLDQDGPEFDPSINEDGKVLTLTDPPLPANPSFDEIDPRDAAEIAALEAEIEAQKQIPLPIDRKDNQRAVREANEFLAQLGDNFIP